MAVVWPHVCQYLIDNLPGVPGWNGVQVFDGPESSGDDPTDYVTVGHVVDDNGGSFAQDHTDDFLYTESGTVRGTLVCQAGDDALSVTRVRATGLLDQFDTFLRHDQSLGGIIRGDALLHADNMMPIVNRRRTAFEVVWTVAYTAMTDFPG